jgi:hypothetical protein
VEENDHRVHKSTPHSLRFILIVSSHLRLGVTGGLSSSGFVSYVLNVFFLTMRRGLIKRIKQKREYVQRKATKMHGMKKEIKHKRKCKVKYNDTD